MITKSRLGILLSKLEGFYSQKVSIKPIKNINERPNVHLEQYQTDPEIASEWLWNMYMLGDVAEKKVIDQGAGTGILGIGAYILGAKEVIFIESEFSVLEKAKENYEKIIRDMKNEESETKRSTAQFQVIKTEDHMNKGDTVIQNPPFGTRQKGIDIIFLKKAFESAPIVYSMHKSTTREHIQKVSSQEGFKITHTWTYHMPLKATYSHHTRKIHRIDVDVYRFEKRKGI